MSEIDRFIDQCYQDPSAHCSLVDFARAFRSTLADPQAWPRSRVLVELSRRFPVGTRANVMTIGGIALAAPAPNRQWQAVDGRLALV